MAIFHCSVRVHSRSRGESATAGAAYRLGARIVDARTGVVHDYRRRADIAAAFTLLPPDAPPAFSEPAALWNAAEAAESRKNSCVSREVLVALPAELTDAQREALACELAAWLVDRYAVGVSVGLHRPEHGANWHAHLLTTTRRITAQGLAEKVRVLDDKATGPLEIEAIRAEVARATNATLTRAALPARVDHRTLEAQRLDALEAGNIRAALQLDRAPTQHHGRAPKRAALARAANAVILAANRQRLRSLLRHWAALLLAALREGVPAPPRLAAQPPPRPRLTRRPGRRL